MSYPIDPSFLDDEELRHALINSPPYSPVHKTVEIDPGLKTWWGYRRSEWLYRGFTDIVERRFDDYFSPWVIERQKSHECHLSGYIDGPTFGLNYGLFYNSVEIGSLEIEDMDAYEYTGEFTKSEIIPLFLHWFINRPLLIPHSDLQKLSMFFCVTTDDYVKNDIAFAKTMQGALWNTEKPEHLTFRSAGGIHSHILLERSWALPKISPL